MEQKKTVLHVLANSSPDLNGYAIRSHDLLLSLKEEGICNPIAITSPFYPDREAMQTDAEIEGIKYFRTPSKPVFGKKVKPKGFNPDPNTLFPIKAVKFAVYQSSLIFKKIIRPFLRPISLFHRYLGEKRSMKKFESEIIACALKHDASMIHAHTPFRVGLPALKAARKLEIPFVYEVRGMWEDSAVAQGRWKPSSIQYKYYRRQENKVIRLADEVIAIGRELGNEIIQRNLRLNPPVIVPNAIGRSFAKFPLDFTDEPPKYVNEISKKMNLGPETITIGYIGSLRKLEGVDDTAKAVAKAIAEGVDLRFLVCSSKPNQDELIDLCTSLGIQEVACIEGPFPHDEIVRYYDLIDIFVVSRPDTNVTRIVPPIKPLEAMARSIPTVVSDLPALREIVTNNRTGMTFEAGNTDQLKDVIVELYGNSKLRNELGVRSREFVLNERTWPEVVQSYDEVYRRY